MSKKFSIAAADLNDSITRVFVGSIRKGITDGFRATVQATKQDSSNAAVHWMVGASDGSNASSRVLGSPSDLRGTLKRPSGNPLVGRRGEHRSRDNSPLAKEVVEKVVSREVSISIDKYAKGHKPSTRFYYYNALLDDPSYAHHAYLETAGSEGVQVAVSSFEREVSLGRTRRHKLR